MRKLFVILIILNLQALVFSQKTNGEVLYKELIIEPQKSSSNKKSPYQNIYESEMKRTREAAKTVSYTLKFNESESLFKANQNMSISDEYDHIEMALVHVNGDGERYFSNKSNVALWAFNDLSRDIILADTINSNDWKITRETKTIGSYKVIKAIRNKVIDNGVVSSNVQVTAWFTPEIPASYGPIGYYGLPGLILEIQEQDFIVYAEKVTLSDKPIKIKKPAKGDLLTEDEYQKFMEEGTKNLFSNPQN